MALTHNRVRNNYKFGTQHIQTSKGIVVINRPLCPLPGIMQRSTNGTGGVSRGSVHPLSQAGLSTGCCSTSNRKRIGTKPSHRKHALTSGTVGTSWMTKRAWRRRAKYCNQPLDSCDKIGYGFMLRIERKGWNMPPKAHNVIGETNEDTSVIINLKANDIDGSICWKKTIFPTPPLHGTVYTNGDKTITYIPDENWWGVDTFEYQVVDCDIVPKKSNKATITITIHSVDDAPVAYNASYQITETSEPIAEGEAGHPYISPSIPITLTANDISDNIAGGAPIDTGYINWETVEITKQPDHGGWGGQDGDLEPGNNQLQSTVNIPNGVQTFYYKPNKDYFGQDTIQFKVKDNANQWSNIATITITIDPANDPPQANNQGPHDCPEDGCITITLDVDDIEHEAVEGDLGHDGNPVGYDEGHPFLPHDPAAGGGTIDWTTFSLCDGPFHGTITNNENGTVQYCPETHFYGTDFFKYTISDTDANGEPGLTSNCATVIINVTPINDPPIANDDNAGTVTDPSLFQTLEDTDLLIAFTTLAENDHAGPLPPENHDPIPPPPATGEHKEEEEAPGGNGFQNDAVDPQSIELRTPNSQYGPFHGNIEINSLQSFNYSPNNNWYGTDYFQYRIQDTFGEWSNWAIVTIIVNSVNDAPHADDNGAPDNRIQLNEDYFCGPEQEDGFLITLTANDNSDNIVGGAPNDTGFIDWSTFEIETSPSKGTLNTTSVPNIKYCPGANNEGNDLFTWTVKDNSGAVSNIATVYIHIIPINDPPIAINDNNSTYQNVPKTLDLTGNDYDIDVGDDVVPSTVELYENTGGGQGAGGGQTISTFYGGTVYNNGTGTVYYTPATDWNSENIGDDFFYYKVQDSEGVWSNLAQVNINVLPNEPPIAYNQTQTLNEDTQVVWNLSADARAPPEDYIVWSTLNILTWPSNGSLHHSGNGQVTYTPSSQWCGTDYMTYQVYDAFGAISNAATVTINVNCISDPACFTSSPPDGTGLAGGDYYEYNITTSDPDEHIHPTTFRTITASVFDNAEWLTLIDYGNGTAKLSGYVPDPEPDVNPTIVLEVVHSEPGAVPHSCGIQNVYFEISCAAGMDVAFIIDYTGSMGGGN